MRTKINRKKIFCLLICALLCAASVPVYAEGDAFSEATSEEGTLLVFCTCGATDNQHTEGCMLYVQSTPEPSEEPIIDGSASEGELSKGEEKAVPEPDAALPDDTSEQPPADVPENPAPAQQPADEEGQDDNALDSAPACTCVPGSEQVAENCPVHYTALEQTTDMPACTCNTPSDMHTAECPLYKAPVDICELCGGEDGNHIEGCSLAEPLPVICKLCGGKDGTHEPGCRVGWILEEQTISARVGNLSVSISGIIPVGAKVSAIPVSEAKAQAIVEEQTGNEAATIYFAIDVCILMDDIKYQPEEFGENVKVTVSNLELEGAKDIQIYHVKEDSSVETFAPTILDTSSAEFNTASFSIMVAAEDTGAEPSVAEYDPTQDSAYYWTIPAILTIGYNYDLTIEGVNLDNDMLTMAVESDFTLEKSDGTATAEYNFLIDGEIATEGVFLTVTENGEHTFVLRTELKDPNAELPAGSYTDNLTFTIDIPTFAS